MIANIEERIGKDGITAEAFLKESDNAEELAHLLETAQTLFSQNTLYFAWGVIAFVVLLIFFINLGFFGNFCRGCGFPAFMIGTIYFLAGLGISPILSIIELPVPEFLASSVDFTAGFIGAILMDISVTVLIVGLILIVISFISDAIARRKYS